MSQLSSFIPQKRTLMGPGPSDVSQRVLDALARPTLGHLDPAFIGLMDETKTLLQEVFCTQNSLTMPLSAPGSAGMEAMFVNLLEPGDKVIVCVNGVFGGRMKENAIRVGARVVTIEDPWGEQTKPEKLEKALKDNPDTKAVAFVHAETSTGVRNDAKTLCAIAKSFNCLTIVDAVTSLAGIELRVDDWNIDAIYSGTQKCLSCVPGLAPISFSDTAVEVIKSRKTLVQSWFLDMNLVVGYWGEGQKRAYHHTAPVNSVYALHESLLAVHEEGLENSWARHARVHQSLKSGLEELGLKMAVDEAYRLPQLNSVLIPEGVDDAQIRSTLLNEFNLEIGAGLGALASKVWRIGLMGTGCTEENVEYCVSALRSALNR
ncbi:alanine--glyoxylate aminotransferase family protein [Glaciecola sp. XM2]|uniref:pyridoxal-phosphate-dependent aminotransferase family protein n=1 Tax=Glaciecola sp. XM2 TaxID=1914931 RepID=UPI001BDF2D14|nr:alanine--glyoxylate aminotransferase family protein [Glaciecola sp. XM2]MBT1449541.1 alanine--glyoxylate aminotransferase family protein [Glaciecola sp. XM2]